MSAIEINNLSKSYKGHQALIDVSLNVDAGICFALLGPNGAGKTTLVKCLLDLLHPDSGTLRIFGVDSRKSKSRENIAFLPEKFTFFPYYSVQDSLEFFALMNELSGPSMHTKVVQALGRLGLTEIKDQKVSTLSKGQYQRIGIASLIIGEPKIIYLDEPFYGLDPIGIKEFKDLIREWTNKGVTVFINSHILADVEQMCQEFAILDHGKLLIKEKSKLVKN